MKIIRKILYFFFFKIYSDEPRKSRIVCYFYTVKKKTYKRIIKNCALP